MSKRLEMLDTMIAKGSNDPFVHYARAMELRSIGQPVEALASFRAVALAHPSYVPTYLIGAQVAEALGQESVARDLLQRGIVAAEAAGDGKALSELKGALVALGD